MSALDLNINTLAGVLVGELVKALGLPKKGVYEAISRPLVWKPMVRFSKLAVQFEDLVVQQGWQRASDWFISHFVNSVDLIGQGTVPKRGPLIIASNHPGAYDSLVISAKLPRSDIKIISSPIPFLQQFPFACDHLIFSNEDPYTRMGVLRKAIQHLREGGALLVFARGTIDPDPAYMPGTETELTRWSSSLGLMLRKVPESKLSIIMISGILDPRFIDHPLTILRRSRVDKQRISEFFQVICQLLTPGRIMVSPRLSFSAPVTLRELGHNLDLKEISSRIIQRAQEQYRFHRSQLDHMPRS